MFHPPRFRLHPGGVIGFLCGGSEQGNRPRPSLLPGLGRVVRRHTPAIRPDRAGDQVQIVFPRRATGHVATRGAAVAVGLDDLEQPPGCPVFDDAHGLNPELTSMIDEKYKYRIYVSVLTTISLDNHNWIPTTDNRMLRRIIRDYRFRGYSARDTIARWPSVRRGEDKWIFPYQENADAMNCYYLYVSFSRQR